MKTRATWRFLAWPPAMRSWKWTHQRPTVISITNAALFVRQPAANMRLPRGSAERNFTFFLWHKHMVLHIFVTLKILTHKCFYTLQMKRRTAFCFFEPGPRRSYTVVVHATHDNVISHVTTWLLSMRPMSPHFSICAVCHPCPVVMQLY